jgi:hypothetical protein
VRASSGGGEVVPAVAAAPTVAEAALTVAGAGIAWYKAHECKKKCRSATPLNIEEVLQFSTFKTL